MTIKGIEKNISQAEQNMTKEYEHLGIPIDAMTGLFIYNELRFQTKITVEGMNHDD